jgi:hypothetical protein
LRSLDNLIDNNAFIIKVTVHKNDIIIGLKALMDIGAQAWILANQKFCERIANCWKLPRITYDKPAIIKGLENTLMQQIQHLVPANLQIQGRMFKNTLLLETNLGDRRDFQLIIGLRFLAYHQINLYCADRTLLFPQELPFSGTWKSDILIPQQNLHRKLDVGAQKNVQRRDRLWNVAESSISTAAFAQPDVI